MTDIHEPADVLSDAAGMIAHKKMNEAAQIVREGLAFVPVAKELRKYNLEQQMEQFFRDGFIDRYFGTRLVNPGMLRVLSETLPNEFPFHPNWKTNECHDAYWELQPTIDHVIPIAQGGADDSSNWATTSMRGNQAKSRFKLDQLHWTLYPEGAIEDWDGLSSLFLKIVEKDPSLLRNRAIRDWQRATAAIAHNRTCTNC